MFLAFLLASCFGLESDRIQASDLAKALPGFAALAPDTVLGHAPVPGAVRVLQAAELRTLAAKHGIVLADYQPVCFEWPMARLDPNAVLEAMTASLGQSQIEIISLSEYPVPRGELVFSRQALASVAGTDGTLTWKGRVQYTASRRIDVWARVRIAVPQTRVVLKEAIPAGSPLRQESLTLESYTGVPATKTTAVELSEVAGLVAKTPMPAGTVVQKHLLEQAKAVRKGDLVQVEVKAGATRLLSAGKAVSAGAVGSLISIENIESKRTFTARVDGPGKVVVDQ